MVKSIIVDDEEKNREALAKMLDQFCPNVEIVGKAQSVAQAKKLLAKHHVDLVFLDIEMPGGDGFSLLREIEKPTFETVFTTAHAAYAIKAIKFAAMDYLLKPINLTELKTAIEKVEEKLRDRVRNTEDNIKKHHVLESNRVEQNFEFTKIALPAADGVDFHEVKNIIRCEADRAYCNFYFTDGRKLLISKCLKEFEDILEECNFYRVHKSNMVNLNHITSYVKGKGGYIVLSDGAQVDVAIRKKEELISLLAATNIIY